MSFSGIAIEQRQKEIKALKPFLAFSMIGSLVLHLAVLASGIANLLARVPEMEEEPIELTFIEPEVKTPPPIETKPEKLVKEELAKTDTKVLTSGGSAGSGSISLGGGSPAKPAPIIPQSNIPQQKTITTQPVSPLTQQNLSRAQPVAPVQKLAESFGTPKEQLQPSTEQQKIATAPQQQIEPVKPVVTDGEKPLEKANPENSSQTAISTNRQNTPITQTTSSNLDKYTQPEQNTPASSEKLRSLLGDMRDLKAAQTNPGNASGELNKPVLRGNGTGVTSGNGSGTGSGNGFGSGTGSGNGSGSGTGSGNGSGNGFGSGTKVATSPITPTLPKPETKPQTISRLNAAECEKCELKYPESARRRGIEGNPKVQFDVDENGRTINVRLARSSGNNELDAAAVEQAREFKLKPSAAGKRNVQVSANYVQRGSRQERQVQERRRQREEQRRQEVEESANLSRQQVENNLTEEAARQKREVTADVRTSGEQQTPTRRKRRNFNQPNQSSDSNGKLRSTLRQSRESVPAAEPTSAGE